MVSNYYNDPLATDTGVSAGGSDGEWEGRAGREPPCDWREPRDVTSVAPLIGSAITATSQVCLLTGPPPRDVLPAGPEWHR